MNQRHAQAKAQQIQSFARGLDEQLHDLSPRDLQEVAQDLLQLQARMQSLGLPSSSASSNHAEFPIDISAFADRLTEAQDLSQPTGMEADRLPRLLAENRVLRDLLGAVSDADPGGLAVVVGPELRFAYVNPAFRFLLDYSAGNPIGQPYGAVWPPDNRELDQTRIETVLYTGIPIQDLGYTYTFPDGTQRRFTYQARRINWAGQPAALIILWDNTELVLAQAQLAADGARYRRLIETATEGIWTVNAAGETDFINPRGAQLLGYRVEEMLGRPVEEFIFPEDRPAVDRRLEKRKRGFAETLEVRLRRKNGSEIWVTSATTPMVGPKGEYQGVLSMFADSTQRRKAEQALRESEQKYRTLFEAMSEGFVVCELIWDEQGRPADLLVLDANPAMERQVGLPRDQVLGRRVGEILPIVEPFWYEQLGRVVGSGQSEHFEGYSAALDRWFEVYAYVLNHPNRLGITFRNITERKQAEQRLIFQAGLLESVHEAVIATDLDLKIIAWNQGAQHLYGWTAEEAVGQVVNELLQSVTTDQERTAILRQLEQTETFIGQMIHHTKAGQPIDVETHIVLYRGPDGGPAGYISSNRDITERKRFEESLRLSHLEMEAERERWQYLVEGIVDEVWVCDLSGRMSLINLETVTAMGLLEFKDRKIDEILEEVEILNPDGQPRPAGQSPLLRSLVGEVVRGEEIMRHRQTGITRWRQYSSAPMRAANGAITGSVAVIRDITDQKESEAERSQLAAEIELKHRLIEQREQERVQIARDLHDGPVQELTGAQYALAGILDRPEAETLREDLIALRQTLTTQVEELRTYAGELRPPALAKFGLGKAIRSHLDSFQESHPELRAHIEEFQAGELIPEWMRLALFRIYQEAMTNLAKHAQASEITIRLSKNDDHALLAVEDNGKGFSVPQDWMSLAGEGHLGLVGMRERAEAIGGTLQIASQPGEGTKLQVVVPVKPVDADAS